MKARYVGLAAVGLIAAVVSLSGRSAEKKRSTQPAQGVRQQRSANTPEVVQDGLIAVGAGQLKARIRERGAKATLVNAWATWCGPCKRELPMLVRLGQKYKHRGVKLAFVSVDDPKDAETVVATLKERGATLPSYIVRGSIESFKREINPRWPGMLPVSFLFDAEGELRHFWAGEAFQDELVPILDDFLAGKPIEAETRYGLAPGRVER